MKLMHLGMSCLMGAGLLAFAPAAFAISPVSDYLAVYDAAGNVVASASVTDANENPNTIYYVPGVAIDANQFGNYTVLTEPDGSISDAFGIATGGPDGLDLAFQSDGDPGYFGPGPNAIVLPENGPVSATMYLDPGLQAKGYTAVFWSDSDVPEPAAWAMMLTGFGLAGLALRRRTVAA